MSEDIQPDVQKNTSPEIDTPFVSKLSEAHQAVESGVATPAQEALVTGFNAGAAAADDFEPSSDPRGMAERVVADDLFSATQREIARLEDERTTALGWGGDERVEQKLQGQKEFLAYLEGRNSLDKNGKAHDAENGQFVSNDEASDAHYEESMGLAYEDMALRQLLEQWAKAEDNRDRTTAMHVQDELQARLLNETNLSEDLKGKLIDRMHADMLSMRQNTDEQDVNQELPTADEESKPSDDAPEMKPMNEGEQHSIDEKSPEATPIKIDVTEPTVDQPVAEETPEMPAIEAAPVRIAIEAAPERLAIEAAPERLAIEAAPEAVLPELSFEAGAVKDVLKHVGEEAVDRVEEEKANMGKLGRFRQVLTSLKFTTLFKRETERKRGQEVIEGLNESVESQEVPFSIQGFLDKIHGQSVATSREQEGAFLDALADDALLRAGDVVLRGENGQDLSVIAEVRQSLKGHLLEYLDTLDQEGVTDEERAENVALYEWNIEELMRTTLEANPGSFDPEAFQVMAHSAFELMESSKAFLGHEDGRQKLEASLDAMKISIGQAQIGPNSSYNTEYLERTVEQMQRRRVGSVVGKASFVVGTWVATGALAAGASQWAAQSLSTSGARYGGAAVGGILLGPVGAAVGFGAGVAASAVWGRHLARSRAMETVSMMEVKSGDSGSREVTALFQELQQDTVSYTVTEENLRTYLDSSGGEPRLREDLSPVDLRNLITGLSEVRVRLGVEAATNSASLEGDGRQINLFSATDPGAVQAERVAMIQTLQMLETQLQAQFSVDGVPVAEVTTDTGEKVIETEQLDAMLLSANAESATGLAARMAEITERRNTFVRSQGRRGAIVAGSISASIGIGGALAAELISHGAATTMFDAFTPRSSASGEALVATKGGNSLTEQVIHDKSGHVTVEFNKAGQSGVELIKGGRQLEVTTPSGQTTSFELNSKGELGPEDIKLLKSEGVNVAQSIDKTPGIRTVGVDNLLKSHGGKQMEVDGWLMNGTKGPDGTELAGHVSFNKAGDVIIRHDGGIATGSGKSYDILTEAKKGHLNAYLTNKGLTVEVPLTVNAKGEIVADIPKSSSLHSLFTERANGSIEYKGSMWRIGVPTSNNSYDSVASSRGVGAGSVKVPFDKAAIKISFSEQSASSGNTGFTIPGVAFSGDSGALYQETKDDEPKEPVAPQETFGPDGPSINTPPKPLEPVTVAPLVPQELEAPPQAAIDAPEQPKELEPAKSVEVSSDALRVVPLSPSQIIDRLSEGVPKGLVIEISGQPVNVDSVAMTDGPPRLKLIKGDGTPDFITLDSLETALKDGKVRFNKYLGTNDAQEIANDVRVGEIFYDTELDKDIRVTRTYDNGSIAYEELDESGNPLLREPDSAPRAIFNPALIARLQNGSLVPGSHRGVELA